MIIGILFFETPGNYNFVPRSLLQIQKKTLNQVKTTFIICAGYFVLDMYLQIHWMYQLYLAGFSYPLLFRIAKNKVNISKICDVVLSTRCNSGRWEWMKYLDHQKIKDSSEKAELWITVTSFKMEHNYGLGYKLFSLTKAEP